MDAEGISGVRIAEWALLIGRAKGGVIELLLIGCPFSSYLDRC
jgi:hypothetical protein